MSISRFSSAFAETDEAKTDFFSFIMIYDGDWMRSEATVPFIVFNASQMSHSSCRSFLHSNVCFALIHKRSNAKKTNNNNTVMN